VWVRGERIAAVGVAAAAAVAVAVAVAGSWCSALQLLDLV